jgi:hypothetical protein
MVSGRAALTWTWAGAAVAIWLLTALVIPAAAPAGAEVVHVRAGHPAIGMGAAFALTAMLYALLGRMKPGYRLALGWTHFALSLCGALLIFAPAWLVRSGLQLDGVAGLAEWSWVASLGYLLILAGAAALLALLVERLFASLRRRPDRGGLAPGARP